MKSTLNIGWLVAISIGGTAACSDGARVIDGSVDPARADRAAPLYVVSTSIYSGDDPSGYLAPVSSLEPGTTFDLSRAIEIPESSISARRPDGSFYTAAMAEPVITRWTVAEDGSLQQEESVSFVNLGVSRADASAELFLSDEKAYFQDDASRQIVVWNPRAME